jgi:hypothetical protein
LNASPPRRHIELVAAIAAGVSRKRAGSGNRFGRELEKNLGRWGQRA